MTADVLVVGAGPAGLEAALVLARAGTAPAELHRIGREQAERYGARFVEAEATTVEAGDEPAPEEAGGVRVRLADGTGLEARRLFLATGVEDLLPPVPGVAEAWGETVAHCPYCHGHELRGRPTAVLGSGGAGAHLAGLLLGWTDRVTLCTGGGALDADDRQRLGALGVAVDDRPVRALDRSGRDVRAVVFADGGRLAATAVYVQPGQRPRGPLPDALGLARTEAGHVGVDDAYRTSAPGVWACGDMTTPIQAVQMAAASGFAAAAALNHDLVAAGVRYASDTAPPHPAP